MPTGSLKKTWGVAHNNPKQQAMSAHRPAVLFCVCCRKRLKELMEHATQFPEQYSKVASVQKKVSNSIQTCPEAWALARANCLYITAVWQLGNHSCSSWVKCMTWL
jgi:hypothetical protein